MARLIALMLWVTSTVPVSISAGRMIELIRSAEVSYKRNPYSLPDMGAL